MHWRQFVLDEFVSSDITQEFLDNIRSDLETIRSAKFTTVTRILYIQEMPDVSVQFTSLFIYPTIVHCLFFVNWIYVFMLHILKYSFNVLTCGITFNSRENKQGFCSCISYMVPLFSFHYETNVAILERLGQCFGALCY